MIKNRITYFLVLAVLVLLIFLYEDAITYTALFTVLFLPAASLALALLSRRRFAVEEFLTQDTIVKGEVVQYVFKVGNNSFLPCTSVRVRFKPGSAAIEADFVEQYFSIAPYKIHEVRFNIHAKYRGNFQIGVDVITMYDFLGLFRFHQPHSETLTLTVRPQVHELRTLPLADVEGGIDLAKNPFAQEDLSIISDLRKYQPTDGYKKIHWKISAKRNELISKNYQHTGQSTTAVLVDNAIIDGIDGDIEDALAMEDHVMEGCVSVLAYCVRRQQITVLHHMGGEGGITGDFDQLYRIASGINFGGEADDFDVFITDYSKMQADAENVVVIAKNVTEPVFGAAQTLRLLGNNVTILYFIEPEEDDLEKISTLNNMGIFCRNFADVIVADKTT